MKKSIALLSIPLITLALSGCAYNNPTNLPPGEYHHRSTTIDSKGTTRETERSTNVYYDPYGNKKAAVDTKTSTDPKGLLNKSTTETHKTVK